MIPFHRAGTRPASQSWALTRRSGWPHRPALKQSAGWTESWLSRGPEHVTQHWAQSGEVRGMQTPSETVLSAKSISEIVQLKSEPNLTANTGMDI